jgi:hypothetical protein
METPELLADPELLTFLKIHSILMFRQHHLILKIH